MKTTVKNSEATQKSFSNFQQYAIEKNQTAKVKGGDGIGSEDGIDI